MNRIPTSNRVSTHSAVKDKKIFCTKNKVQQVHGQTIVNRDTKGKQCFFGNIDLKSERSYRPIKRIDIGKTPTRMHIVNIERVASVQWHQSRWKLDKNKECWLSAYRQRGKGDLYETRTLNAEFRKLSYNWVCGETRREKNWFFQTRAALNKYRSACSCFFTLVGHSTKHSCATLVLSL